MTHHVAAPLIAQFENRFERSTFERQQTAAGERHSVLAVQMCAQAASTPCRLAPSQFQTTTHRGSCGAWPVTEAAWVHF
jgi:hypothetical protein